MTANTASHCTFKEIAYGEIAARARADALVNDISDLWAGGPPSQLHPLWSDADGFPTYSVGLNVFQEVATLKDDAFQEEREWRLLSVSEANYAVKTRPRPGGLVPYKDMLVNARLAPAASGFPDPEPRAITQIIVGPGRDQQAQISAVKLLLHRRGRDWLDNVEVISSKVPFSQ